MSCNNGFCKVIHKYDKYEIKMKHAVRSCTYTDKQYKMEFDHAHVSVDRIPNNRWLLFGGVSVWCDDQQSVTTNDMTHK